MRPIDPRDTAARRSPARPWHRVMQPRDPHQEHRTATPLELLFDLSFVVAVAFAAAGLHHGVLEGDVAGSIGSYLMMFFAIWWAWMNFTWFGSAYDTDDGIYRFTVLVQIAGSLVLAAGIPNGFEHDYTLIVVGYLVMRLGGVTQWVRAALSDPAHRPTTVRYAIGITLVQLAWLYLLAAPEDARSALWAVLAMVELAIPAWAERHTITPFHVEHIAERYGLFTIIVLGEAILGATTAVQAGLSQGGHAAGLLTAAGSGLLIVFSLWWLYFDAPAHVLLTSLRQSLKWGYGHYVVFGSAAAIGAGFEILVDDVLGAGPGHGASDPVVGAAMAWPVALFLVVMWFLQVLPRNSGRSDAMRWSVPTVAALIALAPLALPPVVAVAAAAALCLSLVAVTATFG